MAATVEARLMVLKALVQAQYKDYWHLSWIRHPEVEMAVQTMVAPKGSNYEQALQVMCGLIEIRKTDPTQPHLDEMLRASIFIAFETASTVADKEAVVLITGLNKLFDLIPQAIC